MAASELSSPRGASREDDYRRRGQMRIRSQKFCTTPTLVSLLEDPTVLDSFSDHLDASLQSENLDFWLEVAVFRTLRPTSDQARMLALRVWNRYLSPSAPEQVNVPGHLIEQVEARLRQPDLSGVFEACFDHVQTLLESECIPRFVKRNLALRVLTGRVGGRTSTRKAPVLMWLEARLVGRHGLDSRGLPLPPFSPIQWLEDEAETALSSLRDADNDSIDSPKLSAPGTPSSSTSASASAAPPPSLPAGLPADFLSGPAGLPSFDMLGGEDDGPPLSPSLSHHRQHHQHQGRPTSPTPSSKKGATPSAHRLGRSKERKDNKTSKTKDKPKKAKTRTKGSASPSPSAPMVFSNPRRVFSSTSLRGQTCFSNHKVSDFTIPNYLQGVERLLSQTSLLTDKLEARASAMLEACLDEELELTPDVHSFKYALAALRSVANPILAEILVRCYLVNHCSCLSRAQILQLPVAKLLDFAHFESAAWPIPLSELGDVWRSCFVSGATMTAVQEQERHLSPPRQTAAASEGQASSSTDVPRARVLPPPTTLIDSSANGLRRAITQVSSEAQRDLLTLLLQSSETSSSSSSSPSVY